VREESVKAVSVVALHALLELGLDVESHFGVGVPDLAVWVLFGILDGERMVTSVADVFVGNAVLASRLMDLHEDLCHTKIGPRHLALCR
jgi:hypothetical protein